MRAKNVKSRRKLYGARLNIAAGCGMLSAEKRASGMREKQPAFNMTFPDQPEY